METNEKSPQKRAAKAQIETENLQSSGKVDNFAKILYINPMTDFGFKKIFGDAEIMKAFLNDVIQPVSPIEKVTFLDKEMLPEKDDQRGVLYDLLCKTEDDSEFLVEMQNAPQEKFSDRVIFYLSRSISQQGYRGKLRNHKWDYELRPVYGVFLLNFHLERRNPQKLRTLHVTVDEDNHRIFSDKLSAYMIELPCIKGKKEEDCETNIERWMYNLYNMKTSTKPLAFQDIMPVFKTVASQAEFNKMSESEQNRYMRLLDIYRTNLSALNYSRKEGREEGHAEGLQEGMEKGHAEGLQEGMEKGRAEGLQEGMEKGRAEGLQEGMEKGKLKERYNNAKALKENGVPVAIISVSLGLSVEEVEKL